MKAFWILFLFSSLISQGVTGQTNLLINGDFEKSPPNGNSVAPVTGWERSHYPPEAGFNVNANAAKTGRCGMWIYTAPGPDANSKPFQEIKCIPSARYTAEAWFKKPTGYPWTQGTKAFISLTFVNAYGVTLQNTNSQILTRVPGDWVLLTANASAPQNAAVVRYTVNLTSEHGQSVGCVDLCSLKIVQ